MYLVVDEEYDTLLDTIVCVLRDCIRIGAWLKHSKIRQSRSRLFDNIAELDSKSKYNGPLALREPAVLSFGSTFHKMLSLLWPCDSAASD